MPSSFWLSYVFALLVVALLLGGLYAVVRGLARGRILASANRRLVTVLETTVLSQHSALHVVKVGGRYYLVGGGQGHVNTLVELPAEEVEGWLESQRALLRTTQRSLTDMVKSLRGKP
ncbi:MAG TPA: flagellar biosynthetic protein FliO [Candidatus Acidoferrales bacterium]|nr:flagellar biosynthetic protein FliO [Candidatus Acidoferrales bacterium]HTX57799.1 flagellar biosynthetic protein FliO [Candidatus Acidoferrales bacterium]